MGKKKVKKEKEEGGGGESFIIKFIIPIMVSFLFKGTCPNFRTSLCSK